MTKAQARGGRAAGPQQKARKSPKTAGLPSAASTSDASEAASGLHAEASSGLHASAASCVPAGPILVWGGNINLKHTSGSPFMGMALASV